MMNKVNRARGRLYSSLKERAKELRCLYEVETRLNQSEKPQAEVFQEVVEIIGAGWQYPDICVAEILYGGDRFRSSGFEATQWALATPISAAGNELGRLSVYYLEKRPTEDEGPFLEEEVRLIQSLAERLANFLLRKRFGDMEESWSSKPNRGGTNENGDWHLAVKLILGSDQALYLRLARKMLNHLCSVGIAEAQDMLQQVDRSTDAADIGIGEVNIPGRRQDQDVKILLSMAPFELAARHLGDAEILLRVQEWMQQDRAEFLIKALGNPGSTLQDVTDAVRRSYHVLSDGVGLSPSTMRSMNVNLCEHFLTDQLNFLRVAKDFIRIGDFYHLLDRIIMPANSHGKLGGKGAGLLLAKWALEQRRDPDLDVGDFKIPKTWYLVSDGILKFIAYNDLQDVQLQKFREIDDVRRGYPNIIQLFKNSQFPPDVVYGLSAALDDLGDVPLIVRSSSLLEDRLGTAFSGKYKSLFLANQGSKEERLTALMDAIAEIYASVFGPDPIEYRRERGLLEFNEEMGILIQEVVGKKMGPYFLPAFAGVAFSRNEFRWSPRIKRDDGLIRLVPGLGTRAVDRIGDDYPVLTVPGKPNLRVNVAVDEIVRYSPKSLDLINLETATFETMKIKDLLHEYGGDYPALTEVFSVRQRDMLKKPVGLLLDPAKDQLVATFEGLFGQTRFVQQLGNMMKVLEKTLETPVDVEFAHDGESFTLLQCRPQSYAEDEAPSPIPKDVAEQNILFSADRYVSNGWLPDITHIVYVDPTGYSELGSREELLAVGRLVGKLNKLLPKRQFILMGPGRWGSRGDLKLGVPVTYADINNTAMLVEIARQSGSYVPDLSFGTHFFQDLVEARIRYLPLYPDEEGAVFNSHFLSGADNLVPEMVPEDASLAEVVRVIDVPASTEGRILRVLMNADLDEALGLLTMPGDRDVVETPIEVGERPLRRQYWQWRLQMAKRVAAHLDAERFGVAALYLFGSVKNATSGPGSDIDLLVHFRGEPAQRRELLEWLDGWSLCLCEINYLRTGYRCDGLLDVHVVTDEDIANRTSYAVKIGAVTDAARELPLGS